MRDYKKEYRDYHGTSKQKKLRALRNKANRTLSPGSGKEVDHKVPLSKGGSNGSSNWRVVSRGTNRKKYDKTAAEKIDWDTVLLAAGGGAGGALLGSSLYGGLAIPGGAVGTALGLKAYGHLRDNPNYKSVFRDNLSSLAGASLGGLIGYTYGEKPSLINSLAGAAIGGGAGSFLDKFRNKGLGFLADNKAAIIGSKAGATLGTAVGGLPGMALGGELGTRLGTRFDKTSSLAEHILPLTSGVGTGLASMYLGSASGLDNQQIRALVRPALYAGYGLGGILQGAISPKGDYKDYNYRHVALPISYSAIGSLPHLMSSKRYDAPYITGSMAGLFGGTIGLAHARKLTSKARRKKTASAGIDKLRTAIYYREKESKLNIKPSAPAVSDFAGRTSSSSSPVEATKQVATNTATGKALTSTGSRLMKAPKRGVSRMLGRAAKSIGGNAWLPVDAARRGLKPALKDAFNPIPAKNQGIASSVGNFLVDAGTTAAIGSGALSTALAVPAAARAYTQVGQLSGRVGKMRANERIKLLRQGKPRQERIIAEADPRLRGY